MPEILYLGKILVMLFISKFEAIMHTTHKTNSKGGKVLVTAENM